MKTITYNPETHVLVPREPTRDMVIAGTHQRFSDSYDAEEDCYRAMLAAAPQPEPVDSEPVGYVAHGSTMPRNIRVFKGCEILSKDEADKYLPECVTALYTTPQPDRTAELEAALKVARDALIDCEGALDECRDYPITYDTVIETLAKINEVLK